MSNQTFFDKWVGRTVEFTNTTEPTAWKLETRYDEHNCQFTAAEHFEYEGMKGKPSAAYGSFRCRNIYKPEDIAVMKIIMQVPCTGFEYATDAERARQATIQLPTDASEEINALHILTRNKSKSTSVIRHYQALKQSDDGLVPGGFLHYILMDHAPGAQLSYDKFWSLAFQERVRIRHAFKEAWTECIRAGIYPAQRRVGHLFWDSESSKIFIIAFGDSRPTKASDAWRDVQWIAWELAGCPSTYCWYEENDPHPDKSSWTL